MREDIEIEELTQHEHNKHMKRVIEEAEAEIFGTLELEE